MYKEFIECPNCGYKKKEEIRPCNKTNCINYEKMKMECTMCKYNLETISRLNYYSKK